MIDVYKEIENILKDLKPYERIEIMADQNGKVDSYIVHRSQKIVVSAQKSLKAKIY